MTLKDLYARLTERREPDPLKDTQLLRTIDTPEGTGLVPITDGGKRRVILAPMKSLHIEEFTLPFSNMAKITASLRLQAMPFFSAGGAEVFPVILSKKGRTSQGTAWYVPPSEMDFPHPQECRVWPAPLPLVSALSGWNGNGAVIWTDAGNIASMLWQDCKPVVYRWRRPSDGGADKEFAWYDAYCSAKGLDRGGSYEFNADEGDGEELADTVSESLKLCTWINGLNLSRTALEGARDIERALAWGTKAAVWFLTAGTLALSAGLLSLWGINARTDAVRARSSEYYKRVFDPSRTGTVSNPVVLARDKIAELRGTGTEGRPFDETLADLGGIFTGSDAPAVTLDTIRYTEQGIDCTGTAPDQSAVLNFRRKWEDMGSMAQVDNTQFVSGIGYRFDLRVRWQ